VSAAATITFQRLVQERGTVVITDALAQLLREHVRDSAMAAATQAAELQRDLTLRHLTGLAVETELGPCVPLRLVEQALGGGS
jgi:hypothetical protein